jgi:hypothetical protein
MQAAFPRKVPAEIKGIVAGLETDEVVVTERWNEAFVVRQCSQHLGRGTGNVKEKADAILVATLTERPGKRD